MGEWDFSKVSQNHNSKRCEKINNLFKFNKKLISIIFLSLVANGLSVGPNAHAQFMSPILACQWLEVRPRHWHKAFLTCPPSHAEVRAHSVSLRLGEGIYFHPRVHLIYQFVFDGIFLPKTCTENNFLDSNNKKRYLVIILIPQVKLIVGWSHNSHCKLCGSCAMI